MKPPPPVNPPASMDIEEKRRLRMAAHRIQRLLPGYIGEQLAKDIMEWEEFGYRFDAHGRGWGLVEDIEKLELVYAGPSRGDTAEAILHDQIDQIVGQWLDTTLASTYVPPQGASVWERAQRALLTRLRTGPLSTYSQKLTPRIVQLLAQQKAAA